MKKPETRRLEKTETKKGGERRLGWHNLYTRNRPISEVPNCGSTTLTTTSNPVPATLYPVVVLFRQVVLYRQLPVYPNRVFGLKGRLLSLSLEPGRPDPIICCTNKPRPLEGDSWS
jgi:hypothetical protein